MITIVIYGRFDLIVHMSLFAEPSLIKASLIDHEYKGNISKDIALSASPTIPRYSRTKNSVPIHKVHPSPSESEVQREPIILPLLGVHMCRLLVSVTINPRQ